MKPFLWGVIGPGAIAGRFVDCLSAVQGARLHAVHGRDTQRCEAFLARCRLPDAQQVHCTTSLATLLADAQIDAIYIATPHSSHAGLAARCLEAGKPVLCEKPLTATRQQTETLLALAAQQRCFLMEALWTRFLPVYQVVGEWLGSGKLGALQHIQSSFCFPTVYDPHSRLYDPQLAGGALLDIGIYNLAMTRWAIAQAQGHCPEPQDWHAQAVLAPSGVEQRVSASLRFDTALVAQFVCGLDGVAPNSLVLSGSAGCIVVPDTFWQATSATLVRPGLPSQSCHTPFDANGFEYEVRETMRCVRAGLTESALMPHAESLALSHWLDALRGQLGLRFPFE